MVTTIALIVLLILAGLVLLLFELLTPTFGPLAAMGLAALVGAVWLGFTLSGPAGVILLIALLVFTPAYIVFLVRMLPRLPGSRKLFLEKVPTLTATGTPDAEALEGLVGKIGKAETLLRPSGAVRVEGRRLTAVAESGLIEKDATVKVIASSGMNVIVRRLAPESAGPQAEGPRSGEA
jgi:membrane-bound ClpP family serine protease